VLDVGVGEHDGGAVVVHGRDAGQSAGGSLIEHEDLALGFTLFALHDLLAVHLQKVDGLFDESRKPRKRACSGLGPDR
jgi:hypothetical protein